MPNDELRFRKAVIRALGSLQKSLDQNVDALRENTQATQGQQKPPVQPIPDIRFPPEIIEYAKANNQNDPGPANRDKTRLNVERAGVSVAIILAILTLLTLSQIKRQSTFIAKQVEITQKQLEAADRPWIKIVEVVPRDPLILHEGAGPSVGITFVLKNVGNSVARNVTLHPLASLLPWGRTSEQIIAMQEATCRNGIRSSRVIPGALNEWDVFPGDILEKNDYAFGFLPQAIDATARSFPDRDGKFIEPIVYGCIDYHSPVSDTHFQTGFLYFLRDIRATPKGVPFSIRMGADVAAKDLTLQRYVFGGNYAN